MDLIQQKEMATPDERKGVSKICIWKGTDEIASFFASLPVRSSFSGIFRLGYLRRKLLWRCQVKLKYLNCNNIFDATSMYPLGNKGMLKTFLRYIKHDSEYIGV